MIFPPWGGLLPRYNRLLTKVTHMQDEKVTIQVAAKAIGVTPKTVHQWLKTGALTRVKDGNRTYILMDEVRALRQNRVTNQKRGVITFEAKTEQVANQGYDMVPIKREHYEGLLTRLGQLEASQQLLLEYKEGLQEKEKALEQARENISSQAQELAAVRFSLDANSKELDQARDTISKCRNELQRLLQVQQEAEAKGKALVDQRAENERLRAELERARCPWWKRLFRK